MFKLSSGLNSEEREKLREAPRSLLSSPLHLETTPFFRQRRTMPPANTCPLTSTKSKIFSPNIKLNFNNSFKLKSFPYGLHKHSVSLLKSVICTRDCKIWYSEFEITVIGGSTIRLSGGGTAERKLIWTLVGSLFVSGLKCFPGWNYLINVWFSINPVHRLWSKTVCT